MKTDPAVRLREFGYVLYRGVLNADDCEQLAHEADRLARLPLVSTENLRTEIRQNDGCPSISKFDPVADISNVYRRLAFDPRILSKVDRGFGEPSELFKDKLVYKLPGHPGFGPHIDITWYQPFPVEILAVLVAIDCADSVSGALEVAPGFHSAPSRIPPDEVRDLQGDEIPPPDAWRLIEMSPGDILLFSSSLPHRSGPNTGPNPRRALFLSYNARSRGRLYLDYYRYRAELLQTGMGDNVGNFGVPAELRGTARFIPPVELPHPVTA